MTGLIYNQHDIPKDVYRYGLRPSAQTGCGWIATYNALKLLGCTTDIPELIRYFTCNCRSSTATWAPPSGRPVSASGNGALTRS